MGAFRKKPRKKDGEKKVEIKSTLVGFEPTTFESLFRH